MKNQNIIFSVLIILLLTIISCEESITSITPIRLIKYGGVQELKENGTTPTNKEPRITWENPGNDDEGVLIEIITEQGEVIELKQRFPVDQRDETEKANGNPYIKNEFDPSKPVEQGEVEIGGLKPGEKYVIRVTPVKNGKTSGGEVELEIAARNPGVDNFIAGIAANANTANLTWEVDNDPQTQTTLAVESYKMYMSKNSGEWVEITPTSTGEQLSTALTPTSTNVNVQNLEAGSEYVFRIEIYVATDQLSSTSKSAPVVQTPKPNTVSNFRIGEVDKTDGTNIKVPLTWNFTGDDNFKQFVIQEKKGTGSFTNVEAANLGTANLSDESLRSVVIQNIESDVEYTFRIYVENTYTFRSDVVESESQILNATPGVNSFSASANAQTKVATLTWNINEGEDIQAIDHFVIEMSKAGAEAVRLDETAVATENFTTALTGGTTTTIGVDNIEPGVAYVFTIKSYLTVAETALSLVDTDSTTSSVLIPIPNAPTSFSAVANAETKEVTLSWEQNVENNPVTMFEITMVKIPAGSTVVNAAVVLSQTAVASGEALKTALTQASRSVVVSGIDVGAEYGFTIKAENFDIEGPVTNLASSTYIITPPEVSNLKKVSFEQTAASGVLGNAVISWDAYTSDLTGYEFEYKLNTDTDFTALTVGAGISLADVVEKTAVTATIEGLNVSNTYDVRMRAVNYDIKGSWANVTVVRTAGDVTSLSVSASSIGEKTATLAWTFPAGSTVDGFDLEIKRSTGSTYSVLSTTAANVSGENLNLQTAITKDSRSVVIEGFSGAANTYDIRIRAYLGVGTGGKGEYQTLSEVFFPAGINTFTAGQLRANNTLSTEYSDSSSVVLSWTVSTTAPQPTGFVIETRIWVTEVGSTVPSTPVGFIAVGLPHEHPTTNASYRAPFYVDNGSILGSGPLAGSKRSIILDQLYDSSNPIRYDVRIYPIYENRQGQYFDLPNQLDTTTAQ